MGEAPRARRAVVGHGEASLFVVRWLHRLTDGDGDGFADRFGGADYDDGDPAVFPGAPECPDDGRDENCVGGDVASAALAHRRARRPSAHPDAPRRDILLVTMDAVRADHTSAYGYRRRTTPTLEALAARGTRFDRAVALPPSRTGLFPPCCSAATRPRSACGSSEASGARPPRA